MLSKPTLATAVCAASILLVTLVTPAGAQAPPAAPTPPAKPAAPPGAPAAPAAPPVQLSLAAQNRLLEDAEKAFTTKEYATAVAKLHELLTVLGPAKKDPALEILYFNVGLGNLLGNENTAAEAAFTECIKRYPKGEYTSRCHLGVGSACIAQGTPEKKQQAIEALKTAAMDPKYRSEAGLRLGQVYTELGKHDEALVVFRSLMGSDVRTPQQTTAAVEAIGLLADTGKLDDLSVYLDGLSRQSGVRDALAWFANQIIARGDELVAAKSYDTALIIYRAVPPRSQIVETQSSALESMRRDQKLLEATVASEQNKPIDKHSSAAGLLAGLKPAIELATTALKAVEDKADLDAALLMRRGRCLFFLDRSEEALVCFRVIRTKYAATSDAEFAAYAEIVILNKLQNLPEIKEKGESFMRKYPKSENLEKVATLTGEVIASSGDWKEVGAFYRGLETQFPHSESLERYVFFQGLAFFMERNFKESSPIFVRFLKDFPNSELVEKALYYTAMSNFMTGKYKETLASCKDYLSKFPDGQYAGDMRYRLSFIDFNDKDEDQSAKIIRELGAFLSEHPDDSANGSMLCLLADTYKKKKLNEQGDQNAKAKEALANEDGALAAYKKAVLTASPDDVMQYALDSATAIMQKRQAWSEIAAMHAEFMKSRPDSPLALISASWVARMYTREGKGAEAAAMLATAMGDRFANPASDQVEFLIDELVKTLVPKKKAKDVDIDAVDKQLVAVLTKISAGKENATTSARTYFARARLAQLLKRNDRSNLYLKGIATTNAKDPTGLSPALLSVSGDILINTGDLDGAEVMFKRLCDRYHDSTFSDAGPVGLGFVALARKQYEVALKIFDDALDNNTGMSKFKETTLGKLESLVELNRLEPAEKLALQIVGDKMFRGETAGKAYLLLAQVYRKQAAKATGADGVEFLKKAYAYYQRVYIAYQAQPEICAEAYWEAYETAKKMGESDLANENLKALSIHPKLKNTLLAKKAAGLVK
ncbi:MAG: tetratricopeptide repeat protein [Verrucomicrobiota bacterium]